METRNFAFLADTTLVREMMYSMYTMEFVNEYQPFLTGVRASSYPISILYSDEGVRRLSSDYYKPSLFFLCTYFTGSKRAKSIYRRISTHFPNVPILWYHTNASRRPRAPFFHDHNLPNVTWMRSVLKSDFRRAFEKFVQSPKP